MMNGRAITAFPISRNHHRQVSDITFHKKESNTPLSGFSFGSSIQRPFTTIGSTRKSTAVSPPKFSWVDKGWLAACALPTEPSHYKYLFENGIRHVVSLMKQRPQGAMESVQLPKLNKLKIRIDDFCAPTLNQIRQFIQIVEDANDRKEAVAVHCANGNGCTGTMLACYLVKMKRLSGQEAVREIRKLRPGSVESLEQENAVGQYYRYLRHGTS